MPTDLYTDATYKGQVMRGNVENFATAANYKLRVTATNEIVALFLTKEDADAAQVVAGGSYSVVAGPGYDAYQLPQRKLSLGAMPGGYEVAGKETVLVKA